MAPEFPGIGPKVSKPSSGFPLPAATQCEILAANAIPLQPALEELTRQAAQAVIHNDDTSTRVLSLDEYGYLAGADRCVHQRAGVDCPKVPHCVVFDGVQASGENLAEVLKLRSPDLPPIIQTCDALPLAKRAENRRDPSRQL